MRESGLLCKQKPKSKPYSPTSQPSIPNLLKDENIVVTAPNQVWQADLTYITLGGFIYLAAILDAFTRKCIGWALPQKPDQQLSLEALKIVLQHYKTCLEVNPTQPQKLIHHSDQGVQYTTDAYIDLLPQNHLRPAFHLVADPPTMPRPRVSSKPSSMRRFISKNTIPSKMPKPTSSTSSKRSTTLKDYTRR